jgi:hypothetical protein
MERRQQPAGPPQVQAQNHDQNQQQRSISFGCIKVAIDQAEKLASRESWRDSFKKLMASIVQVTPISTLQACSLIPYDSVPVSCYKKVYCISDSYFIMLLFLLTSLTSLTLRSSASG